MALNQPDLGAAPNDGTGSTLRELAQIVKDIITNMFDTVTGGITYLGGKVGIGISIAVTKLHIVGTALTSAGSSNLDIVTIENDGNCGLNIIANETSASQILFSDTTRVRGLIIYDHATDMLELRNNANTGIAVDVDGKIDMQEVYNETTASAENVFVDTDGSLRRSTSSEKSKTDIVKIDSEYSKNIYRIAKEAAIFYKSLCKGDNPEWTFYGLSAEKLALIEPRLVHYGYLAEDYETLTRDIEIEEVVKSKIPFRKDKIITVTKQEEYKELKKGAKMSPAGVQYSRFIPLILVEIDRQNDRINDLEKRLLALEKK